MNSIYTRKFEVEDLGRSVTLQIWDTVGTERFTGSIPRTLYRDAVCVILVFSLEEPQSFFDVPKWRNEAIANVDGDFIPLIVGNKCDM